MKYPILKILIGIPASGKSTWAKEFVTKNDNWCIVSRDDFRYAWQNKGFLDPKFEAMITEMVDKSIETLLGRGVNVIYDATNTKASAINPILKLVRHTARVEFQIFDVPIVTALERDLRRERSVGKDVIERMYSQYRILLDSFDFSHINPIPRKYTAPVWNESKPDCIIVDIDGTLAHTSGKRSPYDYDKVDVDDCDRTLRGIVNLFHGEMNVIIVSGREDSCRQMTEDWLKFYDIDYNQLIMRRTGDTRKDSIIKEEIFWEQIEPHYNVIAVFDDRDQVVKMWRSLGLKCLQVDYGNF
jgi:predicted kinase